MVNGESPNLYTATWSKKPLNIHNNVAEAVAPSLSSAVELDSLGILRLDADLIDSIIPTSEESVDEQAPKLNNLLWTQNFQGARCFYGVYN